jgi:hypothetical protein
MLPLQQLLIRNLTLCFTLVVYVQFRLNSPVEMKDEHQEKLHVDDKSET